MQASTITKWDLGEQWAARQTAHPESSFRDDARALGVSEAELVATECGSSVTRLCGGWVELLRGLQELGPVSLQTEANGALIDARGIAVTAGWSGRRGVLRVGASRLRVQLDRWDHGFAARGAREQESLQFFDGDGDRILTVGRLPETMSERWTQLVRRFTSADQRPWAHTGARSTAAPLSPAAVDAKAFRRAWDGLRGAGDFADMLQRFGLSRCQALRLVGEPRARQVPTSTLRLALRCAANAMVPLSLAVDAPGVSQNYTGLVRRVEIAGELLVVVEAGVRLYANELRLATAWLVRRPSEHGTLSSLQYFDAADQLILTVAGNTTPGEPGLKRWERLVASL